MSGDVATCRMRALYATDADRVDAQIRFNRDDDMTRLADWIEKVTGFDPLHSCASVFRPSLDDECGRCMAIRATCVVMLTAEQTRERVCLDCAVAA